METIGAIYNVTQNDGFEPNPVGPMSADALEQHLQSRTLENITPSEVFAALKATGSATLYFLPPISLLRTRVEIQRADAAYHD